MQTLNMQDEHRHTRQQDLVPPDRLLDTVATVIGVGAIGRQVALQLCSIGVPKIQIIDFDTVEVVNLGAQGFLDHDLGETKVEAVKRMCNAIDPNIEIEAIQGRFRRGMDIGNIVFSCVDDMSARTMIFNDVKDRVELFVDGRMAAETLRILCAWDEDTKVHYEASLFEQDEGIEGTCTAKTTIYSANIAAGLMVCAYTKHIREILCHNDILFSMTANSITDMSGEEATGF